MEPNLNFRLGEFGDQSASAVLLPSQFTELLQRSSARSPEMTLMAAVLHDAIRCFCECEGSRGVRSRKLFDETAEWFALPDDSWPFAFENICAVLRLEPEWIRGLLRRWQNRRGARKDPATAIPRVRLRVVGRRHAVGAGASGLAA
jgi:hypothetical protein